MGWLERVVVRGLDARLPNRPETRDGPEPWSSGRSLTRSVQPGSSLVGTSWGDGSCANGSSVHWRNGQCGKPERFSCAVAPCHVEDGGVGQWGSEEGAEVVDSEIGSGIDGVTAVGWWRRSRPMSGSRAVRPKVRRNVARPASLQPNEMEFSGERSESAATTG